jgi:hypothetical protein
VNNNTTHPKQQTTVKILEAIVLYLVCLFCLSIGIYYLLLDKPATAATGFVFAIFLFSLAKLDDFNVIEAVGLLKFERRKRELENYVEIANQVTDRLKKSVTQFEVGQFLKAIPERRPVTTGDKIEQRKIYDEFTQKFADLGCSTDEIKSHLEPWNKKLAQLHADESVALAQRKVEAFDENFFGYWELCNIRNMNSPLPLFESTATFQRIHKYGRGDATSISLQDVKTAGEELKAFLSPEYPDVVQKIDEGIQHFEKRQSETIPPLTFPVEW